MANEWPITTIGEIAARTRNALVGGPFGSDLVSADYTDHGIPVIRGQNMGGRWVSGEFAYVSPAKAEALTANLARPGDLVFTQRGTLGQVSIVPDERYDCYLLSQSQMKLTADPEIAEPTFLYYVFRSPQQLEYIRQHAIQTGVPHTNLGILRNTPLYLPPISEQKTIARILGSLDDKIELNQRMNETLEATARALFKSWFVDFDPVRAKAEGRDSGLAKSLSDLFPSRFVRSDLGDIPEGWAVRKLGDLIELAYGKALTAEDRAEGRVPVFGSNGQVGWHDSWLARGPGIVVGRKGNPGTVMWVETDYFVIDTAFYVVPKEIGRSLHFLFQALRMHDLASLGADSAVPGLNRNMAYMSLQVVPPQPLTGEFEVIAGSISARANHCAAESRALAALRDALLPKLISGELRAVDTEKFIRE